MRQALPVSRATVTVHPDCTVVAAISSWAIAEAETWAVAEAGRSVAMVVRRDAEVTGVWAGADLDEVLEIGTTRSGVDLTIPGEINTFPKSFACAPLRRTEPDATPSAASPSHPLGRSGVTIPGECRSISSTGKDRVQQRHRARFQLALRARGPVPAAAIFGVLDGCRLPGCESGGLVRGPQLVGWRRRSSQGCRRCDGCRRGAVVRAGDAAVADTADPPVRGLLGRDADGARIDSGRPSTAGKAVGSAGSDHPGAT